MLCQSRERRVLFPLEVLLESHLLLCRRRHLLRVVLIPHSGKQNKYPGRSDEMPVWEYG